MRCQSEEANVTSLYRLLCLSLALSASGLPALQVDEKRAQNKTCQTYSGTALKKNQVAHISRDLLLRPRLIVSVDGVDCGAKGSIELLPGAHELKIRGEPFNHRLTLTDVSQNREWYRNVKMLPQGDVVLRFDAEAGKSYWLRAIVKAEGYESAAGVVQIMIMRRFKRISELKEITYSEN